MSFIRKIKRGKSTYYAEVENVRIGTKVVQRHIRYLGTDPNVRIRKFSLEKVHFGYITQLILQDTLTPGAVFKMLENKYNSNRIPKFDKISIDYDFIKKTLMLRLLLANKKSDPSVKNVGED